MESRWGLHTRLLFRFSFAYLGLYCLTTKISGGVLLLPDRAITSLGILWPLRPFTFWIAENVLGVAEPLQYTGNSWDTNFFWAQAFWVLVVAVVATAAWSVFDWRRQNYLTLQKWFTVFLRLALASQMFEYGTTKVIPVQFPYPSLTTLMTPVGNVSMQGLLWTFIGASPMYQILTGVVEMLAGFFLLLGRTTMLGALIALLSMLQVFAFNVLYDVGVKMISFHLLLIALFLLAPEFARLTRLFILDRPVGPSARPRLFRSPSTNRIAAAAQIVFGLYMVAVYTNITGIYWYQGGGGSPRSPLYGVWQVEELSIDGEIRLPELNDYDRQWQRVIFDEPNAMAFQRIDNSFARYGVSIDMNRNILVLSKGESTTWRSGFVFQRPDQEHLVLVGDMDGYRIQMRLSRVALDTFQLLNSHFRWVRPPDP
jgi:uncharacterized membrane protein YphA (DoxX/SURF4 family)